MCLDFKSIYVCKRKVKVRSKNVWNNDGKHKYSQGPTTWHVNSCISRKIRSMFTQLNCQMRAKLKGKSSSIINIKPLVYI